MTITSLYDPKHLLVALVLILCLALTTSSAFTQTLQLGQANGQIKDTHQVSATPTTHAAKSASDKAYEQLRTANDLSQAFKHVATALRPSVVSITAEATIAASPNVQGFVVPRSPHGNMFSPFERSFTLKLPTIPKHIRGAGSGVIVSEDGYVLTNNHVVKQADRIQVTLHDNRTFPATVVGTDEDTDVAVLKIAGANLHPIQWGDSESAEVGEWVVAIGSPFGLDQTVTSGIISAKGRDNMGIVSYEDFIQTDAAINPGNSGGPLVNLKGELIGINTAIASRSGAYNGIGFAIPTNMAKRVMDSIVKYGQVSRGFLGAAIQDLTPELASSFGITNFNGNGVLVGDVVIAGPAAKAGIVPGDIVTQYDRRPLRSASQLRNRVAATMPDTNVEIEVLRNGQPQTITVTIGKLESKVADTSPAMADDIVTNRLGLRVEPLRDEFQEQLNVEPDSGVVVTAVAPGMLAHQAGLKPGDVIGSVGARETRSLDEFRVSMEESDLAQGIRLRVQRGGMNRFVVLKQSSPLSSG